MAKRTRIAMVVAVSLFCALMLGIVVLMNAKNSDDLRSILTNSIKSQLVSISVAARETLDVDAFERYNSVQDVEADKQAYDETLGRLRNLASHVGAEYIYALKEIGGQYYFVFDTDTQDEEIFIPYELSDVHERAFAGESGADVMNVDDQYGSFNTGAVPIMKGGRVIGIISADIADTFLQQSYDTYRSNEILLIASVALTMAMLIAVMLFLLKRVKKMQKELEQLAHRDTVTGLPNRQYLLEHLAKITCARAKEPFALVFIDLDNFKKVNDGAGHDAGDELLKHIALYLETSTDHSIAFRPSAGSLNISARIGGDEFIQIVSGVSTKEEAAAVARGLLDGFGRLSNRFIKQYNVGLSIGVALYPYHTENYNVLIKYADQAMYEAKNGGKNGYRIYSDDLSQA